MPFTLGTYQDDRPSLYNQGLFEQSMTAKHSIGTRRPLEDGRVFVYAKAGTANLNAGQLCVASSIVDDHVDINIKKAASVGDKAVTVTLGNTSVSLNQYKGGFLIINNSDGKGYQYKIRDHAAADASGDLEIKLYDAIKVALTTSSKACLIKHPYDSVVISATDQLDLATGVPPVNVTAGYYFWLQTWGPCSCLADETLAIGNTLTIGTGTAGAVEVKDAISEQRVAIANQAGVDGEYRQIFLTIQP